MKLKELVKRLEVLKTKEFVETSRRGPTGIGHLLENESPDIVVKLLNSYFDVIVKEIIAQGAI